MTIGECNDCRDYADPYAVMCSNYLSVKFAVCTMISLEKNSEVSGNGCTHSPCSCAKGVIQVTSKIRTKVQSWKLVVIGLLSTVFVVMLVYAVINCYGCSLHNSDEQTIGHIITGTATDLPICPTTTGADLPIGPTTIGTDLPIDSTTIYWD